jgi:heat shock protein HtpX
MTYALDFFQHLRNRSNVGISIYLALNVLLVLLLLNGFSSLWNFIIAFGIYAGSVSIALSPVGEWILRFQLGCKKLQRMEHKERLMPLFDEVKKQAQKIDSSLPEDVQLFICKDAAPNAFATGRKTICVTKGLLSLSDNEIKAVLAHEFGHLSRKDTDLILIVTVGNLIVTAVFAIIRLFFWIMAVIVAGIGGAFNNDNLGQMFYGLFIDIILVGLMWAWTKIGILLVMHSSRQTEYLADEFAHDCGYGEYLTEALDNLEEVYSTEAEKGLWANLTASHPETDDRVGRLQMLNPAKQAT